MFDNLRIAKGGILLCDRYDEKSKKYIRDCNVSDSLAGCLNDPCEIDEGVVFKDLLLLIRNHTDYSLITFLSFLFTSRPEWLGELVAEGLYGTQTKKDFDYIEMSWYGELNEYDGLDLEMCVQANGKTDKETYALDFTPTYELLDYEVKLNNKIKLYDRRKSVMDDFYKLPEDKRNGSFPFVFEAEKIFTLEDILKEIFWELTFHGNPKNRDAIKADLEQRIKDVDEGKTELIPWEQIKERIKKGTK